MEIRRRSKRGKKEGQKRREKGETGMGNEKPVKNRERERKAKGSER